MGMPELPGIAAARRGQTMSAMADLDAERAKRARGAGHIHLTYLDSLECTLPGCNGN